MKKTKQITKIPMREQYLHHGVPEAGKILLSAMSRRGPMLLCGDPYVTKTNSHMGSNPTKTKHRD